MKEPTNLYDPYKQYTIKVYDEKDKLVHSFQGNGNTLKRIKDGL